MPYFTCRWKDKHGNIVEKDIFGEKLEAILEILKDQGHEMLSAREKKLPLKEQLRLLRGQDKFKLSIFARQMSTMLQAGVSIVNALSGISEYEKDEGFKKTLQDALNKVYMGYRLSRALGLHKSYFSDFFVSLVKVGEGSGNLPYTLEKLADYYERDVKIINNLKSSLFYPAVVLLNGVIIFSLLMFIFVPSFTKTYEQSNMQLPLITKILVGTVSFITAPLNIILIASVIIACILLFLSYIRTPLGRRKFDEFVLKIPLFGNIINKVTVTRLIIGVEVLYSSGVALLNALTDMKGGLGNKVYEDVLDRAEDEIKHGSTFAATIASDKRIPKVVSSMISVGEESGRLSLAFKSLVRIFEDDVNYLLDSVLSIIEPVAIVLLAVMIGFVMVALFLPLYNLIQGF